MGPGFRMPIEGQLSEVVRVAAAFEAFASEQGVPTDVRRSVQVVLDDLLANVVLHGLGGREGGEAVVDVGLKGEALILTISDNGPPFDPFARAAPDTTLSIEDRQIGGLGIHLVRQMMDEVSYERREGRNVTTLTKRISDRTPHGISGEK
jgi:anti-sigma regulatory factor (Ser/Thr protein kinase)